ncbi:acetyl-CoA carboxylase, carboxyltransferase subunit beta [Butyrivibrio sp. NC3005]|uniref:acetyl-CoA carboxylase, carboxyltransferase subunit beta n=1 Tax=Butyrivibrio sp. NC3005 TaxID=1280685 RepID=UPI00041C48B2|nr:acetyl-CoA carboxylase, carboxyltransferase subunit beta [Butyrivibrio sp. NC3005]
MSSLQDKLFISCPSCKRRQLITRWQKTLYVCPVCGHYLPMGAASRMKAVFDIGTIHELDSNMSPADPIEFEGYTDKVERQQKKTGLKEASVTAYGKIGGMNAVVAVLDSHFFMGSMSSVVGEKVTRAIEFATKKKYPLIIFSASGGARMQEGIYSLMQMAKTSDAIEEFSRQGGLFISYLTHPTTGGVTASFASLGDITLAEPNAMIGFAGPRVIEQTIGKKLPKGFQRAEYLESHGFVDKIVPRDEMRDTLIDLLKLHCQEKEKRGLSIIQGALS